jgi:hypothetical protein
MNRALRRAYPLISVAAVLAACAACGGSAAATGPAQSQSPSQSQGGTAAAPVLGRVAGDFAHGAGFGQVKPARIDNGGDPTGLVTHISWKSWGGGHATGTGTGTWVGPHQAVAQGRPATVTVEAFRLGMCHGKLAYRAVEWYFPGHGQSFNPHRYENICSGSFVPQQ